MRYLVVFNGSGTEHFFVDARDGEEAKRKGAELGFQRWGRAEGRIDAYRQEGPPLRYVVTMHVQPRPEPPLAPDVFSDAFEIGTAELVSEISA